MLSDDLYGEWECLRCVVVRHGVIAKRFQGGLPTNLKEWKGCDRQGRVKMQCSEDVYWKRGSGIR